MYILQFQKKSLHHQVKVLPKEFRTGGDVIPKAAEEFHEDNPHVYDSVKTTVQEWCVVDRRFVPFVKIQLVLLRI